MGNQEILQFEEQGSLFLLLNGAPVIMSTNEIFDTNRFDTFHGVSYVASPKFFATAVRDFKEVVFILGIPETDVLSGFESALGRLLQNPTAGLEFFNQLPSLEKNRVVDGSVEIRYGKATVSIHDKIYLLSNSQNDNRRVIIGSANLSFAAFGQENKNFENLRIDDNKDLYDIYFKRFQFLYGQTVDFIPERCKEKYKEKKIQLVPDAEEKYQCVVDAIEENRNTLVIDENCQEELRGKLTVAKRKVEQVCAAIKVYDNIITKKRSNGTYGLKNKATLAKHKISIKKIFSPKGKESDTNDKREQLVSTDDFYLYKMIDAATDEATLYSEPASPEKITDTLRRIDTFIQAYNKFAVTPNPDILPKVYEAILYAFTAPFLWRIKQLVASEYGAVSVADIPIFLIIGGASGSGKSTLLKFLAILMGLTENYIHGSDSEIEKAGKLMDMFETQPNLFPIFADELSTAFFGKSGNSLQRGEALIKRLSNMVPETYMGTLIGTTNHAGFYTTSQVVRRIYYLSVSNPFKKTRAECDQYMQMITDGLSDALFKDFAHRFGEELRNRNQVYKSEDFLFLARKIFRDYYKESGMTLPNYFPLSTFNDYGDLGKQFWRQLYLYNKEYFVEVDGKIRVDTNGIVKDRSAGRAKYKEMLRNYLDESCVDAEASVGLYLFLKPEPFFRFIEYEKNFAKRAFSIVKRLLGGNG